MKWLTHTYSMCKQLETVWEQLCESFREHGHFNKEEMNFSRTSTFDEGSLLKVLLRPKTQDFLIGLISEAVIQVRL